MRFSRPAACYRLQGRNDGALRERLKIVDFSISGQRVANEQERRHSESPDHVERRAEQPRCDVPTADFSAQQ